MGRSLNMTMRQIGLVLLVFSLLIGICAGAEENIYKIMILGNVKVEEGVIRGAIKSRDGGPFSVEKVREDLRSIFDLGYFTDVQVDIKPTPQGKEVIFIVVEKPSIKEITIKGNEKVKLDDIKEKMTLKPRSILNLEKVKENVEQIRKLYFSKGYYGIKVETNVDYLETNEAVVAFTISEGPKGHIQKIVFKGNKKIKTSQLKKLMTTKQKNIFSIITKTGTLDEDVLKNDLQLLTAYYFDQGYLEAKISEPNIDLSNPKKIRIKIEIVEGPQYRLGNIDFKGDLLTTKEDLFKVLKIKRNDVYSNTSIRKDVNALTEKFANQGYAYVEINPETSVDNKNLLVHLTFEIEKKKRVSYEKIQVVGNAKTRDKVIRRELQVAEGELYSASDMNKSRDRLKRTGFFKEVELTTSRGSTEEKINLDIKVEEAPTGALSFGIGYSSIESVVGTVSISDRNLFGYGYHGSLKVALGFETQNFRLSFTDPYFLGYPYAAGIDLYHENVEIFDTYSYKIIGGDIRFGKELTDKIRIDAMYKLENINVYNVTDDASIYIKDQEGKKTTSAISLSPSIDTRDDYFNPRRGGKHSLFIQNAGGVLGGDNYFVKVTGETSWFFPTPLSTTVNLRAKAGMISGYGGKKVPIYEKFFVGGLQTVRGFEYGMAGPIDINEEPMGGEKMVAFNAELIFPLAREIGLKGAVFWDIGKGFDRLSDITPLKTAVGAGIRWFSPFGPIHIDIGFNLSPKKGEKGHVLDFTAGTVY
ncbi:MAG: outer membrane protein assembly factor BamA [Deltaproteobacteria bacterium CG_4_8_14_3_um_filter_45_9]|nr:MAG: outer membrane protein assembly factor BamA [Deltaproteobacteria bacterium CG_4_8_14_3_um_filter_45_9]